MCRCCCPHLYSVQNGAVCLYADFAVNTSENLGALLYGPVPFPWDSDTMGLGQRQPSEYLPVLLYQRPMEMGHNGTGTQWDRDTTGLGHNRTGTYQDWDTTGLGHTRTGTQRDWDIQDWDATGLGHNGIGSHRVLTPCVTLTLRQHSGTGTQRASLYLMTQPYIYPLRARNVGKLSAQHTMRGMENSDSIPITSFYWGFWVKSAVKCFSCPQKQHDFTVFRVMGLKRLRQL